MNEGHEQIQISHQPEMVDVWISFKKNKKKTIILLYKKILFNKPDATRKH